LSSMELFVRKVVIADSPATYDSCPPLQRRARPPCQTEQEPHLRNHQRRRTRWRYSTLVGDDNKLPRVLRRRRLARKSLMVFPPSS
jgi:hypothetical protein